MTTHKPEGTVDNQIAAGESVVDASPWLAPFDSATVLSLQAAIGNRAVRQLLQVEAMQQAHKNNGNGHSQLKAAPPGNETQETLNEETPFSPLIVDDEVAELQTGQMRKTEFLDRLKISVCGAAEEVFRDTMWEAMGCPYVERWFSHYGNQSSEHVERALRRYAPQTVRVKHAGDYIPIVTERVRRGLSQWAQTGEMARVPEEFSNGEQPRVTLYGVMSRAISGINRVIGRAASAVAGRSVRPM